MNKDKIRELFSELIEDNYGMVQSEWIYDEAGQKRLDDWRDEMYSKLEEYLDEHN